MLSLPGRLLRGVYRHELMPARVRWWFAAGGMCEWFRALEAGLRVHLGERTRPLLSELAQQLFLRRQRPLRALYPALPDGQQEPRAWALLMAGLYRVHAVPQAKWLFEAVGGTPSGIYEQLRSQRLVHLLPVQARWEEMAMHLGELLIVLTESLPEHLPHARRILGDICFATGARYGTQMLRHMCKPGEELADPAALAIEFLRISEYIFHVNPEHWGKTDPAAGTGWLEGTACPWYSQPGWQAAHCGIFGQFQSGISSVFGLRYHLSNTIPKHGGSTCRIDLKPIPLGKRR